MIFNNPIRRFFMPEDNGAPSPEDINNQKKLTEAAKETNEVYNNTLKTADKLVDVNKENKEILEDTKETLDGSLDTGKALENTYRGIGASLDTLLKNRIKSLKGDRDAIKVYKGITNDIVGNLKRQGVEAYQLNKTLEKQQNGSLKVSDVNELLEKSKSRQKSLEDSLNEAIAEGLLTSDQANKYRNEALVQYAIQKKLLDEALKKAEKFEKTLGITYKIFEGINKIPILNSLINIEKVKGSMEKTAATGANAFKVFGSGVTATFSQVGKSLKDPLILLTAQIAILKKFFDTYSKINQQIVNQARQLNISKEQSEAIYKRSLDYAASQRNAFVTGQRILEGREKLNEALGTSIDFTDKEAITAEKLSHYYGISAEQNAHLAVLGRELGQTNKDILDTVLNTAAAQKAQFGGTLNYQKAVQKVSSISGEILTKFKGNVKELTAAVMQADRLGLTLEQVDKIGESLLDFETSIQNELKAELLTGKAINLEKARSAALSGDTVKLTNEIAKQVGNIHGFEKMNTIERKAYAEVFGMSVSEMGDMLRKREFENKMAASGAKTAQEQLEYARKNNIAMSEKIEKDLEAKSLAELQKATFEKIGEILARITNEPMKKLFNFLEGSLKKVESIFGFFSKMTGGNLGSALGAVLLGAPILLGGIRLLLGTAKSIFLNGLTPTTAPWVKIANMMGTGAAGAVGGKGGTAAPMIMGPAGPGAKGTTVTAWGGPPGKIPKGFKFPTPAVAPVAATPAVGGFKSFMGSGLGLGLGSIAAGALTSAATSNMEAGGARTAVSSIGSATSMGLMGASIGSMIAPGIGTAIGAGLGVLVGGISSLVSEMEATREKEEAEKANSKAQQDKTNALLEQLAMRPVQLNINNEGINRLNTNTGMSSANGALAN